MNLIRTALSIILLIVAITSCASAEPSDMSSLVNGVTSICPWGFGDKGTPGVAGPMEVLNDNAVPIVSGDSDTSPSNAIVGVAAQSGSGRIVGLGHDGFFINGAFNLYSNRQFGTNIIDWLQGSQSNRKVLVTTGHGEPWVGSGDCDDYYAALQSSGYMVSKSSEPISQSLLSDVSVLFISCPGPSLSDTEIDAVRSFVSNGGGLFMQGLGWSWVSYQKSPLEENPVNKIGMPYGMKWINGYISDPTNNNNGCPIFHVFNSEKPILEDTSGSVQNSFAISGKVFDDQNGDGTLSSGEQGLQGWEIRLERSDGSMSSKETDENGYYQFDNLPAGSYRLRVSEQEGWTATVPAEGSRKIELVDSNKADVDFGFKGAKTEELASSATVNAQVGLDQPSVRSEKVSGTGSIKKDYYIQNNANVSATVSVDIKNANYYEYTYRLYSDEIRSTADLDLVVEHAESITCSGDAKNRDNLPTEITTLIKNGNLTYNNTVVASNQNAQATQNIITASGDSIDAIGKAGGDNNITLTNSIATTYSESFQSTQEISVGRDTSTVAHIDAITGPLKVSSYIGEGDRKLNTIADVAAGMVSIDQFMNLTEAHQNSKGVIGGATFDTLTTNADRKKERAYTEVGSGNLINLSQIASWIDARYKVEYEYMPVSYQTGTYDVDLNSSKIERD
jgi:hypothetical protein